MARESQQNTQASQAEIRLVIADDHPVYRLGLRQVIETKPDLRIVAEAGDGETALHHLRALKPAVALLDVEMPRRDGFDVARAIRAERLPVAVIFLTFHKDERHFNTALDAGAIGYLLKESAYLEIAEGIRSVAAGQPFVSRELIPYLMRRRRRAEEVAEELPPLLTLTQTERRILQLLAEDKTSKEIAAALCLATRTVEHYRENICTKLHLKGHHALLHFAIEHRSEL